MEPKKEIKISLPVAIFIIVIFVIIFSIVIGEIFYYNHKINNLGNENTNSNIANNIQNILDVNVLNNNTVANIEKNTNSTNIISQNEFNNTSKNNNILNQTNNNSTPKNTNMNNENNKVSTISKKEQAIQEIKSNLKNYQWAKENVYMHKSVFGEKIFGDEEQIVLFDTINNENEDTPIIVVEAEVESKNSRQISIVRYKDGEVIVNNLQPVHNSHVHYEIENNLLIEIYAHMDSWEYNVFKITNNTEEKIESYSGELQNEESNYSELENISKKYSSHEITKELNDTNIDKYIN